MFLHWRDVFDICSGWKLCHTEQHLLYHDSDWVQHTGQMVNINCSNCRKHYFWCPFCEVVKAHPRSLGTLLLKGLGILLQVLRIGCWHGLVCLHQLPTSILQGCTSIFPGEKHITELVKLGVTSNSVMSFSPPNRTALDNKVRPSLPRWPGLAPTSTSLVVIMLLPAVMACTRSIR